MKITNTLLSLGLLMFLPIIPSAVQATTVAGTVPISQNRDINSDNKTSINQAFTSPMKIVTGAPRTRTYLEADAVTFTNDFTGPNADELHMGGLYNNKINLSTTFKPTSTLPPYHATATTIKGVPSIRVPKGFDIFLSAYMSTFNGNQTDFIDVNNTTFKVIANGVDISSNFSIRFQKRGLSTAVGLYLTYTPPTGSNGVLVIGSGLQIEFSIDEPDAFANGGVGGEIPEYFTMGDSYMGGITLSTDNGGSIPSSIFGTSPAALNSLKFFFGYAPTILGVDDKKIELNSFFEPMDGVTANDKHDGDLTTSVTSSGNVNTSIAGIYPVDYSVTDSDGHTTTAKRIITVKKVTPAHGGDITVKYVDENGKEIAPTVTLTGNVGDSYTSKQEAIAGYTFKEVKGNTTGAFSDQAQTITYVYTKNLKPAKDVTVKYVDENGKEIAPTVTLTGNVGDSYTSKQEAIAGYTFKEVKGNTTGAFSDQAQTITYVYTKNSINHILTPNNHSMTQLINKKSHSKDRAILPQTGERLSIIGMIIGIFLIFATVAIVIFKSKRKY